MERRKSDVHVTFKRKRLSDLGKDAYAASATQLESVAPTQLDGAAPPPLLPPLLPSCTAQSPSEQQGWGMQREASYFASLDSEQLLETTSRQTTPAASRADSPGGPAAPLQPLWCPSTAPQHGDADLAAVITQQLAATQHTPCSEEIQRHWPHVQERYREYRRCMAEQQLSPVRLRDFFKHSDERGVPAL
ncbi:hypothetical protein C2E21_2749 [Chlorella sorokiniana]|uniref:Uncharacterized protein n=1 Tax=Chlorella sorokiniana TaxID=3076 RepID=A0A2P6TWX7_CHLSO|nr:hypothetical protein C2E21_2749 [Chlorella sorokiniana]|eukprot:PRW58566.1 hypothetical protein C2E21_2749 [Chlorella sorokiniana]